MINRGKTLSASFIHIEPRNKYIIVRYRVGNELVLGSKLPNDAYEQILLMVKQKSN
jgi:type II secretory ATPase GspE/PulE/Tfp pilus assembly ATPase PilB-like protein